MVLVHGLLVILSSRRFSLVEVSWWVGPCTMGESRITSWIEISRQVSRRLGNRHGKKQDTPPKKCQIIHTVIAYFWSNWGSIKKKTRPNTKTEGLNTLGGTKFNRIAKMNKREYS